jgi:DNA-binding HxlR family transcriptional regulator
VTPRPCSIASALEVVGERWSLLVLREVHYGVHRFADIQRNTGAPRDVLTRRLNTLVEAGVLQRRQYSEHPPRFEYHATAAGVELRTVLRFLDQWGSKWRPDAPQTENVLLHDCGAELHVHAACNACGRRVTGDDVTVQDPQDS